MVSRRVFVGNIYHAEKEDLREFFSKYGPVIDTWIAHRPPGFGYVTFEKEEDAANEIREADGLTLGDETIRVELAKPRVWEESVLET